MTPSVATRVTPTQVTPLTPCINSKIHILTLFTCVSVTEQCNLVLAKVQNLLLCGWKDRHWALTSEKVTSIYSQIYNQVICGPTIQRSGLAPPPTIIRSMALHSLHENYTVARKIFAKSQRRYQDLSSALHWYVRWLDRTR